MDSGNVQFQNVKKLNTNLLVKSTNSISLFKFFQKVFFYNNFRFSAKSILLMTEERDLILYYLRIHFSTQPEVELIDEQQENINLMKKVCELNPALNSEERNILNIAYKNAVSSRRKAISTVSAFLKDEETREERRIKLSEFRDVLLKEMREICLDLISLIDESLLPASNEPEQRVYFEKMKGDYYRYICENKEGDIDGIVEKARQCYQAGLDIARTELNSTNPTFLGLVLNYSVFLYEIMDHKNEAIDLSQKTFADTVDLVDNNDDATYSETTMILLLLHTNHNNWISERDNE